MSEAAKVIQALGGINGNSIHSERLSAAATAIAPGHIVEELAAGTVQEQSTAGAEAQKLVALSNLASGKSIDDVYGVAETVRYGAFHAGQEVYLRVAVGTAAIASGAGVEPLGDGTVRTLAAGTRFATALEAVDNSAGSADLFILVRIA